MKVPVIPVLCVIKILISFMIQFARSVNTTCQTPSPSVIETLTAQFYCHHEYSGHDELLLHESFNMLPGMGLDPPSTVADFSNVRYFPLRHKKSERHCKPNVMKNYENPSCPWHYVLNYDESRIPNELLEAKCNCGKRQGCLGIPNGRCEPVKYKVNVMRKTSCDPDTHVFQYDWVTEEITTGCTCVLDH